MKLWIDVEHRISKPELRRIYRSLLPRIRRVARKAGYAIAVHGSETRDFDLFAIPWVIEAVPDAVLAERINKVVAKYWKSAETFKSESTLKPHGRRAYTIYLGCYGKFKKKAIFIDLSVMPTL